MTGLGIRHLIRVFAIALLLVLSGCSHRETHLRDGEAVGTWKIMSDSVKTEAAIRTNANYSRFKLVITGDGSFSARDVPPGIFFNETSSATDCYGKWNLSHEDGQSCLKLIFSNLPGIMPDEPQKGEWSRQAVLLGKLYAFPLGTLNGHLFYMARCNTNDLAAWQTVPTTR